MAANVLVVTRIVGVVTSLLLAAIAAWSLFQTFTGNFRFFEFILSIYMGAFAVLGICAEVQCKFIFKPFAFLSRLRGRGFFYFFIGSLSASFGPDQVFQFVGGLVVVLAGIFDVVVSCRSNSDDEEPAAAGKAGAWNSADEPSHGSDYAAPRAI